MNNGWQLTPLSDVLKPVSRPETVESEKIYHILGAHWYATGLYTKDIKSGLEIQAKQVYRVEEGDFVYNRLFAWKGSFAVATGENHDCYVSNEFPCFQADEKRLDPFFLWYYFRRADAWDEALGLSSGSTPTSRNRLKENKLLAMEIPLPPLNEQRRIVAHIDALAERIAEALGLRQGAVEEAEGFFLETSGNIFSGLTESYSCVQLGNVIEFRNELIRPTDGVSGELTFVGLQHVESNTGKRLGQDYLLAEELKGRKFRFSPGEIVYGYLRPYLNKVWIADCDGFCSVDQYVLQFNPNLILASFLAYFMRSRLFLHTAIELTNNLQLPRLRSGLLQSMEIPLPTLDEQRRIVAYLDELQARVDALKCLQAESAAELDALLPSVLDQAFRGELPVEAPVPFEEAFGFDPRQQVVLALLAEKEQPVNITNLMKYAFLVQKEGSYLPEKTYNFQAYDYGPFDQVIYSDLEALQDAGLLRVREVPNKRERSQRVIELNEAKRDEVRRLAAQLPSELLESVQAIIAQYGHLNQNDLLIYVYARYPEYMVNAKRRDLVRRANELRVQNGW